MTTIQLAQMIARRTPWKTLTALPVEDASALVTAMNQALQVWFDRANATHTARQHGVILRGPVTIQGTATNGSTAITLTSPPAWLATEGLGSSLQVAGDGRWNRLISLTTLLLPYSGPTGAVTFTLHHDVAPLGSGTVSLCGSVRLVRNGPASSERELFNADIPGCGIDATLHRTQGDPERWQVEPHNPGTNSIPFFVVRVWPMPVSQAMLAFSTVQQWSATMAEFLACCASPWVAVVCVEPFSRLVPV